MVSLYGLETLRSLWGLEALGGVGFRGFRIHGLGVLGSLVFRRLGDPRSLVQNETPPHS